MVSIFTVQTPAITDATDGTDYTLGTTWYTTEAGQVTGARWYFPATLPSGTVTAKLWNSATQALLGTVNFTSPVAGTWNTADFAAPIDVDADTAYIISVYTPDRYVATANFFSSADTTNAPLVAPESGTNPLGTGSLGNGKLGNTDEFPSNTSGNEASYFADVVFESAGGTQEIAAGFIASAATVYAPALTSVATIAAGFISATVVVYEPAVTSVAGIAADFIASGAVVHQPALTSVATVAAGFIPATGQTYAPALSATAGITAAFIASTATVYPPVVLGTGQQLIEAAFIASTTVVKKPRVYGGGRLAPLASVDDIEAILGRELTVAETAMVEMYIEMASDYVRDYTGRTFEYQSNHQIRIQADAHGIIDLPDPPVHAVAAVLNAEDDEEIDGWVWDQMWRLKCIPAWRTCKVTYTHGNVDVPSVITHVVASMASRQLINPAGIRQETVGATSVTYASVFGEAGALGLSGLERQVLERYRDAARSWRI
jgi:hypothetical protein